MQNVQRDFIRKGYVDCKLGLRIPIRVIDFEVIRCFKSIAPARKNTRGIRHAKWEMTISGTYKTLPQVERPGHPTAPRVPRRMHPCGPSSKPPRLPTFLQSSRSPAPVVNLGNASKTLHLPRETQFKSPKNVPIILTSESLSHQNVAQILRIATCKHAPKAARETSLVAHHQQLSA